MAPFEAGFQVSARIFPPLFVSKLAQQLPPLERLGLRRLLASDKQGNDPEGFQIDLMNRNNIRIMCVTLLGLIIKINMLTIPPPGSLFDTEVAGDQSCPIF